MVTPPPLREVRGTRCPHYWPRCSCRRLTNLFLIPTTEIWHGVCETHHLACEQLPADASPGPGGAVRASPANHHDLWYTPT
jgi:hypothetical protein